ncbi:EamA family transporter RarD [Neomegalonema sp.]|uniref:EamA family transporter RarD n=1 Tax=Neomegalonema sp. TaxID=2039713 RepID=UPI002612E723|nr:EamA family transporter RarD [Neomegalonema sp.]MDD2868518.1 EamA family transporter RarD [Neomegalonema sp.]
MSVDATAPRAQEGDSARGFAFAFGAYFLWGFLPLYMKAVSHIPPTEVLAHRVIWSAPVAAALLLALGRMSDLKSALRDRRMLLMASLTAALIAVNWGIYIWAIANDRALDAALGYFINPLFSIFLGAILLREKLQPLQIAALGFVVAGVGLLTWEGGGLPWTALALTFSWGFYAFFRKTLPIGPNQGFLLEVLILLPLATAWVLWLEATGGGHVGGGSWRDVWLLMASGVVTAVPLILYGNGAKLLRLSTIGIMQYIAPTMIFLLAIFVFKEPFSRERLYAFALIWAALVLYSLPMLQDLARRREKRPPPPSSP